MSIVRTNSPSHLDQRGSSSSLIIVIVVLVMLLMVAIGAFVWAFMGYNDYKTNTDAKVASAVKNAKAEQQDADNEAFANEQKKPYLTYKGPSEMGTVEFSYPKTWSGYVNTEASNSRELQVYFYPHIVPKVKDGEAAYALRIKVSTEDYAERIRSYQSLAEEGKVTASAIVLGKTDNFAGFNGLRIDGQLTDTINGSVSVFKVRDKVLEVFADSKDFMNDYNEVILKTLKFTP